jgi:hypothetical protein
VSEKEREMSGESPDLAGGRKRGSSCSSLTFLFLGEGTISGESVPDRCIGVLNSVQLRAFIISPLFITITIIITKYLPLNSPFKIYGRLSNFVLFASTCSPHSSPSHP